jgi:hypothetical protein
MKGEKVFFRKKLFGGFNREDVVTYIAKIAQERNEAVTAKEKAEKEVSKLTRELQFLQGEIPLPATETEPAEPIETIEPTPSFEPILESTPEPEPIPEPEPTPEPEPIPVPLALIFDEPEDSGDAENTIELKEIIKPVDFGYVEETGNASLSDPVTPKVATARVKVVKKIKRNNN